MQFIWFIWSLIILGIWLIAYLARKSYHREMLDISLKKTHSIVGTKYS